MGCEEILGTLPLIAFSMVTRSGGSVWVSGFGWGESTHLAVVSSYLVKQVQYHCDSGLKNEYHRRYERKMFLIGPRVM
jgi:hypothetical protein